MRYTVTAGLLVFNNLIVKIPNEVDFSNKYCSIDFYDLSFILK